MVTAVTAAVIGLAVTAAVIGVAVTAAVIGLTVTAAVIGLAAVCHILKLNTLTNQIYRDWTVIVRVVCNYCVCIWVRFSMLVNIKLWKICKR